MAVLKKINGNSPVQVIDLKDDEVVIGRLPDCDIVLDLQGVSRRHATVRRDGLSYVLVDHESRNKTYLNDEEIPPETPRRLREGDRIVICDVEMVFFERYPVRDEDVIVTDASPDLSTIHMLDASRSEFLEVAVRPEVKLKAILEITRNLSSTLKLESVAPRILESLAEIFPQAERSFLVLLKDSSGEVEGRAAIRQTFHHLRPSRRPGAKAAFGRPADDDSRLSISRTIMNTVLKQRKAVLSQDTGNDPNLPTSASIADLRIRSFMCAPLLTPDGTPLGILQLDTTDKRQFNQEDLDLLVAVAGQASIALQNATMHEAILTRERLDRDLRLAEQIQRRFIPQELPVAAGYEFFAHYQSAYEVGGDFYDFVELPGSRLAMALGDVAGKGVSAALMMAKFSADARYCLLSENEPGRAADKLNELLIKARIEEKFITLCLGVLDLAGRRFTFSSAGHPPIFVRRHGGKVEMIGDAISNLPLGILEGLTYPQVTVELEVGDVVLIYSDGATDGRNNLGELYDTAEKPRLLQRFHTAVGGPEAVGRAIVQDTREYSAGVRQADDLTLVCFGPVSGGSATTKPPVGKA